MNSCQRRLAALLTCVTLIGGAAHAQTATTEGKVIDQSGVPVIGASVVEKGTTNGVMTDVDGTFTIKVQTGKQLEVSCIGYLTVNVAAAPKLSITLQEDSQMLEETVVVGYGTMKKTDVTGAMVSVNSETLTQTPSNNVVEALQGKAAGVYITNGSRPGEVGNITIRGVNTIGKDLNSKNAPLIVIDGVVAHSVGLEMLNPQDIESIEILKDASATAVYGAMGGNGVVLVSTNRGKSGRFSLNYSGTFTAEKIYDKVPMMDSGETMEWRRWAYYYAGLTDIPGDQPNIDVDRALLPVKGFSETAWANILQGWGLTLQEYNDGKRSTTWDPSKVTTTDWTQYTDRVGITQEHSISASGGTDKMKSYVSLGYLDNKGTTRGQEYKRYTFRTSVDITPIKWFTLGGAINLTHSDQEYGVDNSGGASDSLPGSLHARALTLFPYGVPYDSDGKRVLYPDGNDQNPTVVDEEGKVAISYLSYDASASFYASLDFGKMWEPLKGLTFKSQFGPQIKFRQGYKYMSEDSANRLQKGLDLVTSSARKRFSWTLDNMLYYNRSFDKHSVNLTFLQEAMYNMNTQLYSMQGYGIALGKVGMAMTQKWWGLNGSSYTRDGEPSFNSLEESQLASYMVRGSYSYDNRYLLTLSYRYDGASQLGSGRKWQGFPSVALGWRLDQESFLKDVSWISELKLRAGWGKTGNYSVGLYSTKDNLTSAVLSFGSEGSTVYYTPNSFANRSITWETTDQYNIGVDFSVLRGRISGVLDLYKNYTNGLIFPVTLPSASGKTSTNANVGKTENHGFDFTVNTTNISTRDFSWKSSLNLDFNTSKIVELQNGKQDMVDDKLFIGQPISVAYGYESLGIWGDSPEDLAEIAKFNANGMNFAPGKTRIKDLNGDYKIDANNDRVVLGNTRPKWNMGFNNTLRWKNLQLDIFMFGSMGYFLQTGNGQTTAGPSRVINYYTENNKNSTYQRPFWAVESSDDSYAGYLIQQRHNGFLKVRQISLGYFVPEKFVKAAGLKSLKLSAQLKNPFSVFDTAFWMDSDTYSAFSTKGLVFGLNVGF